MVAIYTGISNGSQNFAVYIWQQKGNQTVQRKSPRLLVFNSISIFSQLSTEDGKTQKKTRLLQI
jgi:hypothetical protein